MNEFNALKAPYTRRKTLIPAKVQPQAPENTNELTNLVKPGILKATDVTGFQAVNLSTESNNFQPDPLFGPNLQAKEDGRRSPSTHSKVSQTSGESLYDHEVMSKFWTKVPEKVRSHLYNCMEITPMTQEVKQLFRTEYRLLKTVFSIGLASDDDKPMGILSKLWRNLQVLRYTFLEEHARCKILVDGLGEDDEEDLVELFQLQAFEDVPGVEAVVLNLKAELEDRHQPYEFKIGTSESTRTKLTTTEKEAKRKENTKKTKKTKIMKQAE